MDGEFGYSSFWNSTGENVMKALGKVFGETNQQRYSLIYGIILLATSTITAVANGLVIAVIAIDPLKNLRTSPSNYLVLCLACTDFIVGAVQEFLNGIWLVYFSIHGVYPFAVSITFTFRAMLLTTSMTTLLALGYDRMIAIRSPLQYKNKVTKRKVRIAVLCIWVYGLFHGIVYGNLFDNYFFEINMVFLGHVIISFVILIVSYAVLTRSVRTQFTRAKNMSESRNTLKKDYIQRQKKVTSTIFVILTAFKVCFFPWVLCFLLLSTCTTCNFKILAWAFSLASSLMYINSLINPFLYAYRLPKYKRAFKNFMKKQGSLRYKASETITSTRTRRSDLYVSRNEKPQIGDAKAGEKASIDMTGTNGNSLTVEETKL